MSLQALRDAVRGGTGFGALIHERTGAARRVEVLAVDGERVLAVARAGEQDARLFGREARVRLELPREGSVVRVPGSVARCLPGTDGLELEIDCPDGAEERQRRMDARVDAQCRIRLHDGEAWLERRTVNVSAGGALVSDGEPTHPGDLVDVELDLDGETIRCRAEVVRRGVKTGGVTSRTNAALRFLDLQPAARDRIGVCVLSLQAREKVARHPGHGRGPRPGQDEEDD